MSPDPTHCYVAIAECGCCRAAVVDDFAARRDVSRTVASWVRDPRGYRVERVTLGWVRATMRACPHDPRAALPALAAPAPTQAPRLL